MVESSQKPTLVRQSLEEKVEQIDDDNNHDSTVLDLSMRGLAKPNDQSFRYKSPQITEQRPSLSPAVGNIRKTLGVSTQSETETF